MDILRENLIHILITVLTAVLSYVGLKLKAIYEKYIDTKTKKEIVKSTVGYIEQIYKNKSATCEEKLKKCKEKVIEWFKFKKIKVSDTELDILIESAVNCLGKDEYN